MSKKECNNTSKTLIILMSICVALSIITLGIVVYDRLVRKEPEHVILKPIEIDGDTNKICNNEPETINPDENNLDIDEIIGLDEEEVE